MKKIYFTLVFLVFPTIALAQSCPYQYKYKDRDYVKSQVDIIARVLKRMHFLGLESNRNDLTSGTQRAAMNAEYQALRGAITGIGDGPHPPNLYRKTVLFLNAVIDSSFLELDGTKIDGATREQAIADTYAAIEACMAALVTLELCS